VIISLLWTSLTYRIRTCDVFIQMTWTVIRW